MAVVVILERPQEMETVQSAIEDVSRGGKRADWHDGQLMTTDRKEEEGEGHSKIGPVQSYPIVACLVHRESCYSLSPLCSKSYSTVGE